MITLKRPTRIPMGVAALFAMTCGAAMALEVPRSPAENESIPQAPMMKVRPAQPPERPTAQVEFHGPQSAHSSAFQDLDLNGDGLLAPFEASDDLAADFATWDSNGDGKVSSLEYAHYRSDRGTLARSKSKSKPTDRY